jgi:flagella basal body P-ring formation protein FlgA
MENRAMTHWRNVAFGLALSVVGLTFFIGAAARPDASVVVSLRAASTVHGPEIRLGEIADVHGKDADLVARLRTLEVARAPLPGLERTLDVTYLKARLRHAQFDLASLTLDSPSRVTVTTASRQIAGMELIAAVREHILASRPEDVGRLSVQPTGASPATLVVPAGALELKVRSRPPAELHGTVSATVEAWVDGALARSVSVPVRVGLLMEVLVAARPIGRTQFIRAEDVRVEAREVPAGQEPLREPGGAVGRQATRQLTVGDVILASWVNDPPLVRRGDIVLLMAEGRGLRAMTHGEAREDGKAGQVIRVRSLASGREIYGQVESERTVRVSF